MVSNICLFSPLFGEDSHFDEYFFKGVETTNLKRTENGATEIFHMGAIKHSEANFET